MLNCMTIREPFGSILSISPFRLVTTPAVPLSSGKSISAPLSVHTSDHQFLLGSLVAVNLSSYPSRLAVSINTERCTPRPYTAIYLLYRFQLLIKLNSFQLFGQTLLNVPWDHKLSFLSKGESLMENVIGTVAHPFEWLEVLLDFLHHIWNRQFQILLFQWWHIYHLPLHSSL